jgi:hypothetical protein
MRPVIVPESRGSAIRSRAVMDAQLKIEESVDHQRVGVLHDDGAGTDLLTVAASIVTITPSVPLG